MSIPADDERFLLRQVGGTADPELLDDLQYMFEDMRRQADMVRGWPLTPAEEPALVFVPVAAP